MNLGSKLKHLRTSKDLTQKELANALGVSTRQIQNYEGNTQNPSKKVILKIMEIFNVSADYLLTEEEAFIMEAKEQGGSRGKERAEQIIKETTALFAGGELSQEDKDAVFQIMQEIYWESKVINKKYTPKKYLKKQK
ncbi:helix-turn-helix domain-containing protein [Maledivibacter halophilus]|uniref:Predicted transcriptional regulator n=1 Tax=Maledivibacter halophilus TaxID=36842 RepID=A0A1T5LPK6_9FIRM|nr:helix-turn-helix transcriptional regulator [Maledivibacter halophilus]SKC77489.1 Predicted transcriptional regulator [Maledivibacter halophilus]